MRRFAFSPMLLTAVLLLTAGVALADPDIQDTRLLSQPALSARHVAFTYADNLWVADLDGRNVRRLTSDLGTVSNPVFSPDGSLIAFAGQYEGNTDVYLVPVAGGPPRRLTWHPAADVPAASPPTAVRSSSRRRGNRSRTATANCSPCP